MSLNKTITEQNLKEVDMFVCNKAKCHTAQHIF